MKTKWAKIIGVLLILSGVVFCYGAWDNTKPADNQAWNDAAGSIRDNWDALETVLGVDLNGIIVAIPWINVKAYGATGDGSTDDSTAIQAAIDAAEAAGGGIVFVPQGTFGIGSTLNWRNKVSLEGVGSDTSIIKALAGLGANPMIATGDTAHKCVFENIQLDGDNIASKCLDLSRSVSGAKRILVENVWMLRATVYGLDTTNNEELVLRYCRISLNPIGLYASANGGYTRIYTTTFDFNINADIDFTSGNDIFLSGCIFGGDTRTVAHCTFAGSPQVTMIDIWFENSGSVPNITGTITNLNIIGGQLATTSEAIDSPNITGTIGNLNTTGVIFYPNTLTGYNIDATITRWSDQNSTFTTGVNLSTITKYHHQWATPYHERVKGGLKLDGPLIYDIGLLIDEATPSVAGGSLWRTGGTTTITNFIGALSAGQVITVMAEHSLIITDGTNIFLNGSSNWPMTNTDILTLVLKIDGKWYEISRGDNGA